jgi:hypothetical protein
LSDLVSTGSLTEQIERITRIENTVPDRRAALMSYMNLETLQEKTDIRGRPQPLSPLLISNQAASLCMSSYKQNSSHRTLKASSNRHRKLQPFRET